MESQEPQPPPTPPPPQPPRIPAREVFKKHGIAAIALGIWTAWCIRDGWFREWEHTAFNKTVAVPSAIAFLFCLVMAGSAARTLLRQKLQQKYPPPPAN